MFQSVTPFSRHGRSYSFSSDDSRPSQEGQLAPPVLVYHESARSIVFRDHLRRASLNADKKALSNVSAASSDDVAIANFRPVIQPLPVLELGPHDQFTPLVDSTSAADSNTWTEAELEVVNFLKEQKAVVKTLKNADWTPFLHRFKAPQKIHHHFPTTHDDIGPSGQYRFNSFVTSTTLLPEYGKKMRCFGSTNEYTMGVVFALPKSYGKETEDEAVKRTETWSWPSAYSAKTEFNIDGRGKLINGRNEALVPLSGLRVHNHKYVHDKDYYLNGKLVKGGLNTIPYNEVYVRVGGQGRIVGGVDCATGEERSDEKGTGRSLDRGIGLPVALFVRTATYGHLVSLLRTRARVSVLLGSKHMRQIPLLLITPESGVRVLTEALQKELLRIVSRNLNPFQNPSLAYKTTIDQTSEPHLQQKMEELLDLDSDEVEQTLTPEERARLAGGFGATDDSVAKLLMNAKEQDEKVQQGQTASAVRREDHDHHLQDLVNEGLAAAVRSGDYHTSRQLLILYSLVAAKGSQDEEKKTDEKQDGDIIVDMPQSIAAELAEGNSSIIRGDGRNGELDHQITAPPPPPPLDTDRLRSATNSDGLLAVLGAAQVLKAMQDGSAKRRMEESADAIEEWVEHGEQSMAFRLASWRDQRAAQGDLKIAMEHDSNFMAFVSNKAISNRRTFAEKLRETISATNFEDVRFLHAIHAILSKMNSPCLRLELLQYVLGLDNRYSVAHVSRSVELAATCLSVSANEPYAYMPSEGADVAEKKK